MIVDLNLIRELIKANEVTMGVSDETKKLKYAVDMVEHVCETAELSMDSVIEKLKSLGVLNSDGKVQNSLVSTDWYVSVSEPVVGGNYEN